MDTWGMASLVAYSFVIALVHPVAIVLEIDARREDVASSRSGCGGRVRSVRGPVDRDGDRPEGDRRARAAAARLGRDSGVQGGGEAVDRATLPAGAPCPRRRRVALVFCAGLRSAEASALVWQDIEPTERPKQTARPGPDVQRQNLTAARDDLRLLAGARGRGRWRPGRRQVASVNRVASSTSSRRSVIRARRASAGRGRRPSPQPRPARRLPSCRRGAGCLRCCRPRSRPLPQTTRRGLRPRRGRRRPRPTPSSLPARSGAAPVAASSGRRPPSAEASSTGPIGLLSTGRSAAARWRRSAAAAVRSDDFTRRRRRSRPPRSSTSASTRVTSRSRESPRPTCCTSSRPPGTPSPKPHDGCVNGLAPA